MVKTRLIRVPIEFYNYCVNVNKLQRQDLSKMTNKPVENIKLPLTKTIKTFTPVYNENYIQVNLKDLKKFAGFK